MVPCSEKAENITRRSKQCALRTCTDPVVRISRGRTCETVVAIDEISKSIDKTRRRKGAKGKCGGVRRIENETAAGKWSEPLKYSGGRRGRGRRAENRRERVMLSGRESAAVLRKNSAGTGKDEDDRVRMQTFARIRAA